MDWIGWTSLVSVSNGLLTGQNINFLNMWRGSVSFLFKIKFASIFHDLVNFCSCWFVILLCSNNSLHLFISFLHDQHSLMHACLLFWWTTRWFWTQPISCYWWFYAQHQSVWLMYRSWWDVAWTHRSTLIDELLLCDNFKKL